MLMCFSIVLISQHQTHFLVVALPLAQFSGTSEMENKTTATKCWRRLRKKYFKARKTMNTFILNYVMETIKRKICLKKTTCWNHFKVLLLKNWHINLFANVYSSFIHNLPNKKQPKCSSNSEWINYGMFP